MGTPNQRPIPNLTVSGRPLALAIATLVLAILSGCRGGQQAGPSPSGPKMDPVASDWPRTFTDDLGNTITFEEPPQRIISLSPNLTEIIFLVGAEEQLVGRTDFCDYPPQALAKPSIGGIVNPSLEKLVSLEPDLVLIARGVDAAFLDRLRKMEICFLGYDPQTLDDVIALIQRLGQLTGHDQQGAEASDKLAQRKAQVEADSRPRADIQLRVLFVLSREPLFVAGTTSFVDNILRTCGARNAIAGVPHVDQRRPWPQISRETVVAADPQLIVFADTHGADSSSTSADTLTQLRATPGWRGVAAVLTGQVYTISDDLITIPGPRLIEGLEQISQLVHEAAGQYTVQPEERQSRVGNVSESKR